MKVIEYRAEYKQAVVELMAELQEFERGLSHDRTPGESMAAGHTDYLLRLIASHEGKVYLAVNGMEVVGFAVVFLESEDEDDLHLLPAYRRYGWVSDLIVKQNYRGSDAAPMLLNAAERHCASVGVQQIKLSALHDNGRALRFYQKAGYSPHEVILRKDL